MHLLKKNTTRLGKLSMVKFAYDYLLRRDEENENITVLHRLFQSKVWSNKQRSGVKESLDVKKMFSKVFFAIC